MTRVALGGRPPVGDHIFRFSPTMQTVRPDARRCGGAYVPRVGGRTVGVWMGGVAFATLVTFVLRLKARRDDRAELRRRLGLA